MGPRRSMGFKRNLKSQSILVIIAAMSIESFFVENGSPGAIGTYVFNRMRLEESQGHPKGKLRVLAEAYIGFGGEGIRQVTERLNDRGVAVRPDEAMLKRLSEQERERLELNYAALIMGAAIVTIESSLIERRFDSEQMVALINEALRPTPLPKWVVQDRQELLSAEKLKAMNILAGEDRTLGVFFEDRGFAFLPELLKGPLVQTNLMPTICERLLPVYRGQAKAVLGI